MLLSKVIIVWLVFVDWRADGGALDTGMTEGISRQWIQDHYTSDAIAKLSSVNKSANTSADTSIGHTTEEKDHHKTVTILDWYIALLLFGFLLFDMCLLYLLNYPDPQVQSYSYKMVSTTISIFCAIHIDAAVTSSLFEGVLKGLFGLRIEGNQMRMFGLALSFVLFVILNIVCYSYGRALGQLRRLPAHAQLADHANFSRKWEMLCNGIYGWNTTVSHVVAFAMIATFGRIISKAGKNYGIAGAAISVILEIFILFLFTHTAECLRKTCCIRRADAETVAVGVQVSFENEKHPLFWVATIREGEDELMSLAAGSALVRLSLHIVTGQAPKYHYEFSDTLWDDKLWLMVAVVGWCIVFIGMSVWKIRTIQHVDEIELPPKARVIHQVQCIVAMTVSFHVMIVTRWAIAEAYHRWWDMDLEKELRYVFNAFAQSGFCMGSTIVLNKLADLGLLDQRVLRPIFQSLGLLIGLSWEKAFHVAHASLRHGTWIGQHRKVLTKVIMAVVVVVILWPGWKWYIAPVARLPVPEEGNDEEETRRHAAAFTRGVQKIHEIPAQQVVERRASRAGRRSTFARWSSRDSSRVSSKDTGGPEEGWESRGVEMGYIPSTLAEEKSWQVNNA